MNFTFQKCHCTIYTCIPSVYEFIVSNVQYTAAKAHLAVLKAELFRHLLYFAPLF